MLSSQKYYVVKLFFAAIVFLLFAFLGFYKSPALPEIKEAETFVPKIKTVKLMSLGFNSAAASLFWVNGIVAYSETMFDGKTFKWLSHLANASTSLDSLFKTPYTFVSAITSNTEQDTSDYALLRRGVQTFSNDWHLMVSIALRFANGPGKNYAYAAQIMKGFENDTTVPPHIRGVARTFELKAMPIDIAIIQIIDDSLNPSYKNFQRGLAIKAARILNNDNINEIENILKNLTEHKIEPQIAFKMLMGMLLTD